jgi:hypothetical protein
MSRSARFFVALALLPLVLRVAEARAQVSARRVKVSSTLQALASSSLPQCRPRAVAALALKAPPP